MSLNMERKDAWMQSTRAIMLNFVAMAFSFGTVLGTVTGLLALASASLGLKLGGTSAATLYICYTFSALFTAAGLVQRFGSKTILVSGLSFYGLYVGSFLLAAEVPKLAEVGALTGSAVGGFAAGWVWTAQGSFLAASATAYAKAANMEQKDANSFLGGIFATIFVGCEVVFKLLSSLLLIWTSETVVYIVYASCAVLASMAMLFVRSVTPSVGQGQTESLLSAEEPGEQPPKDTGNIWLKKSVLAASLWIKSYKMKCLTGLNLAFGFTAAFLNFYVNGVIVKESLGQENIGWMSAIVPGVACILSTPYGHLAQKVGKMPIMIFGAMCYCGVAISVLSMTDTQLKDLGWGLSFIYVIAGSGRAVFESTNKATFADFFPDDAAAAFANLMFQSGVSSAFAFFVFPHLDKLAMGLITAISGGLAIIGLLLAFSRHNRDAVRTLV